ncbi:hypothetical protein GQ44DRAFT_693264 [Phaeosphaeriaceae sp. PMI808]|nr:hypothetical protein GQ44DRAFT_693264 [Phaeosphaeriaceae sp. PMI808]
MVMNNVPMSSTAIPKVVPAQLSFLALYNPSLGTSDETFHQQVVFYYSKATKVRDRLSRLSSHDTQAEHDLREQENEKLRQVGLAQGMVAFAKSFSNGAAVDSVETHKSRIVLYELEREWWILASIDLTQLPAASLRTDSSTSVNEPAIEYSAREVSPPALLVQQLIRAHAIFRLHHGSMLELMFARHKRDRFCNILDKYWSRFASTWDVLLHGSPAVDMYNGIKLAAGGELGMGVGEEDWGSSERDVLEDFARRTEGLVDVMVSRFGETTPLQRAKSSTDVNNLDTFTAEPWLGCGYNVNAADGLVFSGLETAKSNPKGTAHLATPKEDVSLPIGIPPPIVKAAESSPKKASVAVENGHAKASSETSQPLLASLGDTETWMKYMTLGYGTTWGGKKSVVGAQLPLQQAAPERTPSPDAIRYIEPEPDVDLVEERLKLQIRQENDGYFLVGLKGDMHDLGFDDENDEGNWNNRIPLRTVHVEVLQIDDTSVAQSHRPFIYTFLFKHGSGTLSLASFYRDIHNFFAPLHRSLDKSTSPDNVAARLTIASNPYTTTSSTSGAKPNTQPIYDLVYDPRTFTIHSSLPNIPDPGSLIAEGLSSATNRGSTWSRIEALNVHSQILATSTSTRQNLFEIERTCKTSRGWWVVWMRLPPSHASDAEKAEATDPSNSSMQFNTDELREAFLVRRARDTQLPGKTSSRSRFASGMWSSMGMGTGGQSQKMGGVTAGWGPKGGLGEGIGVDARRYVEELLSLNR